LEATLNAREKEVKELQMQIEEMKANHKKQAKAFKEEI